MAYQAGILNEEEQHGGMSVLGPQGTQQAPVPAQQGAQPQEQQISGGQSSTIQAGAQAPQANKGKTPKSGMFTNIKKYIQANKPSAERMAKATAEVAQKDVTGVQKALDTQRQQFQQRVQQAQQQQQAKQQTGQQLVQQAMQGKDFDPTQFGQFRQFLTGQQKFTNVGDIDQSGVQAGLERVGKQIEESITEQGRRNLLTQAFGKGPRQYTKGQQSLDQLLLQRTKEGFEGLTKGLTEAQSRLQTTSSEAAAESAAKRAALERAGQDIRSKLLSDIQSGRAGVMSNIEQRMADYAAKQQQAAKIARGEQDYQAFKGLVSGRELGEAMQVAQRSKDTAVAHFGSDAPGAESGLDLDFQHALGRGVEYDPMTPEEAAQVNASGVGREFKFAAQPGVTPSSRIKASSLYNAVENFASEIPQRDLAVMGLSAGAVADQVKARLEAEPDAFLDEAKTILNPHAKIVTDLAGNQDPITAVGVLAKQIVEGSGISEEGVLRTAYDAAKGQAGVFDPYLSQAELTKEAVASSEEARRLALLARLEGIPVSELAGARGLQEEDLYDFDFSKALEALY